MKSSTVFDKYAASSSDVIALHSGSTLMNSFNDFYTSFAPLPAILYAYALRVFMLIINK